MGGPAAEAEGEGSQEAESADAERTRIMQQFCERYDLDNSGDMNSDEELQQTTMNLCVKFELQYSVEEIQAKLSTAPQLDDSNRWTFDDFQAWFMREFLEDASST